MSSLKPPRHYRLARRMDAQQRAYDDVERRRYRHYRQRAAVDVRLDALKPMTAAEMEEAMRRLGVIQAR